MYCLEVIHSINSRRPVKTAVATRDCSSQASRGGYVLHSASARDTVFISGTLAIAFKKFLAGKPTQAQINAKIERIYTNYQESV